MTPHVDRISKLFNPTNQLLATAVEAMFFVRTAIRAILKDPSTAFLPYPMTGRGGRKKTMLLVDYQAETLCKAELRRRLKDDEDEQFCILGEESLWDLPNLDLEQHRVIKTGDVVADRETRLVFILDMIDGTDLLERDFENWCSAAVLFDPKPPKPKVLFSLVHDSRDRLYGAHNEEGAFLITSSKRVDEEGKEYTVYKRNALNGPEHVQSRAASICFYTQKRKHFTTLPPAFSDWLKKNAPSDPKSDRMRLYTLAGNPMMARLANGEKIHAIFEHRGQFPHDAVPGAYIGLIAGTHLFDIETGKGITKDDLARYLLKPSGPSLRYVHASTRSLAVDLATTLRGSRKRVN